MRYTLAQLRLRHLIKIFYLCMAALLLFFFSVSYRDSHSFSLAIKKTFEKTAYAATSATFKTASLLSRCGSYLSWDPTFRKECLLFSQLCNTLSQKTLSQAFAPFTPSPLFSWQRNQALLSHIPTTSLDDQKLLLFLERRWLTKANGVYPEEAHWIYPCFGFHCQVNPDSTNCYARNPALGFPTNYLSRIEAWKKTLPQPHHFPLILTRPCDLEEYLPSNIVDVTPILSRITDPEKWLQAWTHLQTQFPTAICIQRVTQKEISGIRLLPRSSASSEQIEKDHRLLLEWIGAFGLSATPIELDRWTPASFPALRPASPTPLHKEKFLSFLHSFTYPTDHAAKKLMMDATLHLLSSLVIRIPESQWQKIAASPTHSALVNLSFTEIQKQLQSLDKKASFMETTSHLDQIHSHLSTLLTLTMPYTQTDFASIYKTLLPSLPSHLRPWTSYGLHASGMTSFGGILKAVQKIAGHPPKILYGENTYFECFGDPIQNVVALDTATENDWQEADLLLAQFNPVLRRNNTTLAIYKTENISETLHKALLSRKNKPLTVVLDCTLDYIDSPQIGALLQEFQGPIASGALSIFCYRSGIKYDLLGMDNYFGAPFYMIHNASPHWAPLSTLLTDPALIADSLSANWFCLAYEHAHTHLDLYRKQIFDNTRTFLSQIPPSLLSPTAPYRVLPFSPDTTPTFIDLKISGPLHRLRGAALAAGLLYTKSLASHEPAFTRPSFGFYHPNFTMIFDDEVTTIRLTLGLDPAPLEILQDCLHTLGNLNPPFKKEKSL